MSDSQSGGPGFESRSGHFLDLFLGTPKFKSSATLVNSQLVCLRPVGILNNVIFNLSCLFKLFALAPLAFVLYILPRVNKGHLFFFISPPASNSVRQSLMLSMGRSVIVTVTQ